MTYEFIRQQCNRKVIGKRGKMGWTTGNGSQGSSWEAYFLVLLYKRHEFGLNLFNYD